MARSNQKVTDCFAAATGLTNKEATDLGKRADAYNSGDIAADYAAAAADMIAETRAMLQKVQEQLDKTKVQKRDGETQGRKHTVESLTAALKEFMRTDALGNKVFVVDMFASLKNILSRDAYVALAADVLRGGRPIAFAQDGKAYFIADRMAMGTEKGIFLHEVGSHLGLQKLLPDGKFKQLHEQIVKWAKKDDGSAEHLIAKLAMDRADAAGTDADQLANEHVAYFIEEAVNNGIDPVAVQASDYPLHEWVRTLWAAFKGALRRLGFNTETLTAEDIVDLAYGAARLEINGAWHGTTSAFKKFDNAKANSGSGAQAYGYGSYFARNPGTADTYRRAKGPANGTLMRADFNIADDEWLDYDKPLAEQSKKVQDALKGAEGFKGHDQADQMGWYYANLAEQLGGGKEASEYLDARGIKGLKYAAKGSQNLVVFNDKNIIRVASLKTADRQKTQFSKALAADANNALKLRSQLADQIRSRMSPQAKDGWTTIKDFFEKKSPWFLTSHQLLEQFGDKLTSLKTYIGLVEAMTQKRNAQAMDANKISEDWDKLRRDNPAVDKQLSDVMLTATLKEIHPDVPFTDPSNKHLDPAAKADYDKLAAKYNAMPEKAQKIYQKVKSGLAEDWKKRRAAYGGLVDYTYSKRMAAAMGEPDAEKRIREEMNQALAEYDNKLGEMKGPYFPLMRFGEYLAIGESQAYLAAKAKVEVAEGEERRTLQKQLDAMKKDPTHYKVSAHESAGNRRAAMREMTAAGLEARSGLADQHIEGLSNMTQTTMNHIMDVIDADFDSKVATDLNTSIASIFLRALPEMHALRREAQRKGIAGASPDMLRAFSAASQQNAFYTSRLEHASEMADALFKMKAEAKGNDKLSHIHREMEQRMALDMKRNETPIQDAIGSISWAYHLGLSPSFMLINSTQPWLVTGPVLAGKFGAGKATRALAQGTQDAMRVLKAARFKDGKWDAWSGINEESLPGDKYKEDRTAIRKLMERGIVDEGQQHELNMYADDSSRWLSKVNRHMGWATQQIELTNRLGTALAAFRLARKDMDYDAALEYAYRTTLNTQFDYSQEGTARFMREGGGVPLAKLVFQFRRYQQSMLYLLGDNIKKSFGDGPEAKEARATLGYLAMTSGMAAGSLGLPFMGVLFFVANAFIDDDDPEGDAETQYRNFLLRMTGDRDTATVLAKGIPAMFGADLSKRIGLGDIASPLPMMRFEGRTGQEKAGELLLNVLGPAGGLAARGFDGVTRISEGDWAKGLEKLSPKVIGDVSKAARYGFGEGLTDGQGTPTGADIGGWDVFMKSLGVAPTKESNYYEGTAAIKNTQAAVKKRMGTIGNKFEAGLRSGDMSEARELIAKFNADHPENPITPKQEMQWRKQAREAGKNRTPETGIKLGTKRDATYNNVGAFAL